MNRFSSIISMLWMVLGIQDIAGFQNQKISNPSLNFNVLSLKEKPYFTSVSTRKKRITLNAIPENFQILSSSIATSATSATSVISQLASPLGSIFVLAIVILIHELGHFLAARAFGMQVEEFSIGVGPKIFGFQRTVLNDMDQEKNINFNLRALPLGGYVRFPESYNRTLAYEIQVNQEKYEEELKDFEKQQKLYLKQLEETKAKQSFLDRLLQRNPTGISKPQEPTSPPDLDVSYYDDSDMLQNRPWIQKAVVISGGVIFNLILAFTLYFGELTILGNGMPRPFFAPGAVVSSQPAPNVASYKILEKGDVITSVNGNTLSLKKETSAASAQQSITDFIATVRATPDGEKLHLVIQRSSPSSQNKIIEVDIEPKPLIDSKTNEPTGPKAIGVMLQPKYVKTDVIKATSLLDAASKSTETVLDLTSETASALTGFIQSLLVKNSASSGSVSGPIGVIKTGSDIVKSNDLNAVIAFAAAISVNLAVVNSLPFPGLDGGQMVFILSEALSGKKIDQRLQEEINGYALLVLFLLSLSTAVGDVGNLVFK